MNTPVPKKVYRSPKLNTFNPVAAVPALFAPLAFLSAQSTTAFVGGAVVGAAAVGTAMGHNNIDRQSKTLIAME
ncbi:MAG: hypothetical protein Q4C70_03970 [Planctomycetia bacterium]|nr:hypothetical protein [Planctomycetia bacterium]